MKCEYCGYQANEQTNNLCPLCGALMESAAQPSAPATPASLSVLMLCSDGGSKIQVVKVIREATGFGIADAKKIADNLSRTPWPIPNEQTAAKLRELGCDVRGGAPVAQAAPAPVQSAPASSSALVLYGVERRTEIRAIKVIRDATGLGLGESKRIIDNLSSAPWPIPDEQTAAQLRELGGDVR